MIFYPVSTKALYTSQYRGYHTNMIGLKRNLQAKVREMMSLFPVVALLGARQVGKTTLARNILPDAKYVDLDNPDDQRLFHQNPTLFFEQYPDNLIIDEAQQEPLLFATLRGVVDKDRTKKGRFLITGSSSPDILSHISETLAGRICIIEVGTLKANEFYEKPLSSLYDLFKEKLHGSNLPQGPPPLTLHEMHHLWFRGGYPEPLLADNTDFYTHWMSAYRDTYINRDIASLFPKINKRAYQHFLMIVSALSGQILNKSNIGRAIETSEGTVRQYLHILEGTFIWRALSSFEKNVTKSIVKMPKGHMRDAGLNHFLSKIHTFDDLLLSPIMGSSFESFAIEELLKGLEATSVSNWDASYYRTRNGAEIDLILGGPFGTLPVEIKYSGSVPLKKLMALSTFIEEHKLPFGIVLNQCQEPQWLTDKIIQIPIGFL